MNDDAVVYGCWTGEAVSAPGPLFFDARLATGGDRRGLRVVVGEDNCDEVPGLLAGGALGIVLAGTSPTLASQVARLVRENGRERIGVWADTAPMQVRWRLEIESNADFKTLAPSMPEPCWELLDCDGGRTGIRADYWLERLFDLGAGMAVVRAKLSDAEDRDLNVAAGLVERFGHRIWLTPADSCACPLDPWVEHGRVRRFVLPEAWQVAEPEAARAA